MQLERSHCSLMWLTGLLDEAKTFDEVRPFDEASEVSLGLEVLCNAELLKPFLKQRIHNLFHLPLLHDSGDWGLVLSREFGMFPEPTSNL